MEFIIGITIWILSIGAYRIISERAYRTLTDKEKIRLMDGFSRQRAYSIVPMILVLLVVFGLPFLFPQSGIWTMMSAFGAILLYLVLVHLWIARKLVQLELPRDYINRYLLARTMTLIGAFALFGCLMYNMLTL